MTMTAKHVSVDRQETVVECSRVIAGRIGKDDRHPQHVTIVEPSGRIEQYESGTIYVMSDTGATVSQWFIDSTKSAGN